MALWWRLTARPPSKQELELLVQLWRDERAIFAKESARAKKLISVGERPRDISLNSLDLAAMTTVSQAIMNLDATVWKR